MRPKRSARVHRRIRAEFATRGQKPRVGFTTNLSETGMFLATAGPYPVGSLVTVRLMLDEPVEVSTVVVHSRKGIAGATGAVQSGMGLRFLNASGVLASVLDPKPAAAQQPEVAAEEEGSPDSQDGVGTSSTVPETDREAGSGVVVDEKAGPDDLSSKLAESERERRHLEQMLEDDEREKAMLRALVADLEKSRAEGERETAQTDSAADLTGAEPPTEPPTEPDTELDELRSQLETAKGENVRLRARVSALETSLADVEMRVKDPVAASVQSEPAPWRRRALLLAGAIAAGALGALILALLLEPERAAFEAERPDGPAPATSSSAASSQPPRPPAQAAPGSDTSSDVQEQASDPAEPPPVEPETGSAAQTVVEPVEEVTAAVEAWARAWSDQRVEDYLAAYSVGFEPADGSELSEWRQLRRTRIARPSSVRVTLGRMSVRFPSEGVATAVFVQSYETPTYQDRVRKRLRLVDEGGAWLITEEVAEEIP